MLHWISVPQPGHLPWLLEIKVRWEFYIRSFQSLLIEVERLKSVNWGGCHHSLGWGLRQNKRKNVSRILGFLLLCLLTADTMTPEVSCSCWLTGRDRLYSDYEAKQTLRKVANTPLHIPFTPEQPVWSWCCIPLPAFHVQLTKSRAPYQNRKLDVFFWRCIVYSWMDFCTSYFTVSIK